jgi:hypothetical protein
MHPRHVHCLTLTDNHGRVPILTTPQLQTLADSLAGKGGASSLTSPTKAIHSASGEAGPPRDPQHIYPNTGRRGKGTMAPQRRSVGGQPQGWLRAQ